MDDMNVSGVSERIMQNCQALAKEVSKLTACTEANAKAQANYDKALGTSMAGHKCSGEPVGVVKEYAKRDCADELYAMVVAEGTLKATYANIDAIKTRINAYQSILKYLDVLPESQG